MSESSGTDPERPGEEKRPPKPIEKVKADNEKHLKEKLEKEAKREKEKFEKDKFEKEKELKQDKNEKLEGKDIKSEKPENKDVKQENKDLKDVKPEFKEAKLENKELKPENKELKPELEKPVQEGPVDPLGGLDPKQLAQHADALEAAAQQLRHFIEKSERPDLSGGALANEPDEGDDS